MNGLSGCANLLAFSLSQTSFAKKVNGNRHQKACQRELMSVFCSPATRPPIRRRGPWRNLEAVEFATLEWVDWFNNRRLLEPIGGIPPAEAEARYYAQIEHAAVAA